jgi:polyhydroxyalkanoate synthesis regulator phasin
MKNKHVFRVFVAGIAAILTITACSEVTEPTNDQAQAVYSEYVESNSFDLTVDAVDFEDGTLENEIRVRPDRKDVGTSDRRGDDKRPDAGMRHPFGRLLNALNLTEEQRPQVAELLKAHHDCVKSAHALYREHMAGLFERARAARQSIIEQVKNGEITRQEGREKMHALMKALREAVNNSNVKARVEEMMKNCDNQFYRGLSQILTEEQNALLRRYIASLQD